MKISVILPTYNEKENVGEAVRRISSLLGKDTEFIVVDDSSPDGTAEAARKLAPEYNVKVLVRAKRVGLGAALQEGYESASGDLILSADTDLQQNTEALLKIVEALNSGFDFVEGSRYCKGGKVEGIPPLRQLASRTANILARIITGVPFTDFTDNFRGFKREVLQKVKCTRRNNVYLAEFIAKARRTGFKLKETPVTFTVRKKGGSKMRLMRESLLFIFELVRMKLEGEI
ncbi:MAG: polyprenol monophosphomannose synthase [Candidatus Micrarchaeota archaeon]